ncbi:MAG: DUF2157 domain-containing protein [Cyanobacteria bacterium HKST-UBA06]|nr:DUF2157 domain-containing protein [Cyanobacteria bacterium HKST-UBA06]
MNWQAHLTDWQQRGIISAEQAEAMRADLAAADQCRQGNGLLIVLSTLGAVLLGIGILSFVAANWMAFSSVVKIGLIGTLTLASLASGALLKYGRAGQTGAYPFVGQALMVLASLLLGATLNLIGQTYHVNAHAQSLELLWIVGIIPLAFIIQSRAVLLLAELLLLLWLALWISIYGHQGFSMAPFPAMALLMCLVMSSLGNLTALFDHTRMYAAPLHGVGIVVGLFLGFFFCIKPLTDMAHLNHPGQEGALLAMTGGLIVAEVAAWVPRVLRQPTGISILEVLTHGLVTVTALAALLIDFPSESTATLFFTVVYGLTTFTVMQQGLKTNDTLKVYWGGLGLGALVLLRYVDYCWALFDKSLFFALAGVFLVGGAALLERVRRQRLATTVVPEETR